MKKKYKRIITISIVISFVVLIFVSIIMMSDFNNIHDKHMIFEKSAEILSLNGINKLSEQNNVILNDIQIINKFDLEYLIKKNRISITVYEFQENIAYQYFNILMKEDRHLIESYTTSTFLLKAEYCIYKDNKLIYATTNSGSWNMKKFIELLNNNLTVEVAFN